MSTDEATISASSASITQSPVSSMRQSRIKSDVPESRSRARREDNPVGSKRASKAPSRTTADIARISSNRTLHTTEAKDFCQGQVDPVDDKRVDMQRPNGCNDNKARSRQKRVDSRESIPSYRIYLKDSCRDNTLSHGTSKGESLMVPQRGKEG